MGNHGSNIGNDEALNLNQVKEKKSNRVNSNQNSKHKRNLLLMRDMYDSGFSKEDGSSYNGVKSDLSDQSDNSYSNYNNDKDKDKDDKDNDNNHKCRNDQNGKDIDAKDNDSTNDFTEESSNGINTTIDHEKIDLKVPTHFVWREGGNHIYLTGSFCNWNQKFLMTQIGNKFELTLELPRGLHEYKFIVDNKWVFSKHHPTHNDDKGNINNIIDTSKQTLPIPVLIDKTPHNKPYTHNGHHNNYKESNIRKSNSHSYKSEWPSKKDLYLDATACPDNYKMIYHLSSDLHLNKIGKQKYMSIIDNYKTINNSYHDINLPPHVNLNHLSLSTQLNDEVLVTNCQQRIRNKFITLIYYKPVN